MKTKKANRDEILSLVLAIKLSEEEKIAVDKAAQKLGVSMSTLGRMAIKKFIKEEANG